MGLALVGLCFIICRSLSLGGTISGFKDEAEFQVMLIPQFSPGPALSSLGVP